MNLFSTRHRRLIEVSVILAFLGAAPGLSVPAAKIEQSAEPPTISYDASYMDTDFKTQVMHLKDVTITYGKMTVRADRALATARDFKNSRWTFAGNVRINADPRGNLRSDEAVVEFEDNQLKRATATGAPAEFDQKRTDSDAIARGHANQIVYEVAAGTVRLSNDAWITDGKNDDIRGPVIVYSLREEHVEATTSPGTESRVHVTIAPNEAPKLDGAGTNKPKPTAGVATAPTGAPAQPPPSQSAAAPPTPSQSTPPTPR
ncbi:MAG TPA: lipopolysaccharide transport periplasmic protein LptA [Steroidobacteraceae bacterium]|jgi:lipopolysaccharide transport protein LptA|nr:lipopolysaccharide transport periplasmic protein LptA [Steroidobacteraceae bacterium]